MNIKICVGLQKSARCFLTVLALTSVGQGANAGTTLPTNVMSTCSFTSQEFSAIFEAGSVSNNGGVRPANSFSFAPNSLCSFYKWAEQMFLWVGSPVPSRLGSGSHVFESSIFFAVSPLDSNGQRNLIPAAPGRSLPFLSSISQRGSRGQEVVFDSKGKVHDVIHLAVGANGKLLARDKAGQSVEIERIQASPDGKPVLFDRSNKQIEFQGTPGGAPILFSDRGTPLGLRPDTVLVNGRPRLVTSSGAVIETEESQAGGGALMAQNGSLVFYLLQVNDVWAYFNTGMNDNKITNPIPSTFPTTGATLGQINTVAQQAPAPFKQSAFPDSVAMAVEIKSSWIDATGLANPGDYITIDATIPTYDPPLTQPNNTKSMQSGTKPTKLALLGIHIVGSTLGHPEMLWATFEHINNAPNPQYTFTTTSGTVGTQPADGPSGWVLSSTGAAAANPNNQRIIPNGTTLGVVPGQTIGPSDIVRIAPWGTAANDPNFTANNTDIVSLNHNVMGLLAAGDVRRNYLQVGTTWVANGGLPSKGSVVGTPQLANSTMETFLQFGSCFGCHTDTDGSGMLGTQANPDGFRGGLSHIWAAMQPLFR
ncbi:hypothetical protein JJB99_07860 [Bradyrhizobium diazoefficiens]|uniref:hypothetical protein n=1 Tax=Bradyrhizobium diazoefficiens TaxID=1355477 RepID=UPI0019092489|nr:hypothetical protein [Bradyrhizobium diazoefficiens]QQO16058.1 hypothetical protein JJB99_07860 [Bradyrhizobium diazoefficiens]